MLGYEEDQNEPGRFNHIAYNASYLDNIFFMLIITQARLGKGLTCHKGLEPHTGDKIKVLKISWKLKSKVKNDHRSSALKNHLTFKMVKSIHNNGDMDEKANQVSVSLWHLSNYREAELLITNRKQSPYLSSNLLGVQININSNLERDGEGRIFDPHRFPPLLN